MQTIPIYLDIIIVVGFRLKNADVSINQGVCHVIYLFFRSSLGEI